ncbi:peroxin 23 [Magnaporthiopsis poae ATCC 64411]|uniref:Peroxin 23 n=1 Tax=Magnaporthiopsis poae (strain ATCC 64411 / 73-15) TaxID=644358 RepID=A0A0C4E1L3_MAGP6|nr:peroxin 23 [Magnaporthiopsis poae ATCC 64411]
MVQMATPRSQRRDPHDVASSTAKFLTPTTTTTTPSRHPASSDGFTATFSAPGPSPTYAAFSPATLSGSTTSAAKRRSTILVHQKSPLLLATPPQITRALAYSHPFLLPLNKLVGLLTWTTEDQWESFLLVVAFWTTVLYGDVLVRVVGPLLLVPTEQ